MQTPADGVERRRRKRVPLSAPLMVTSLDPGVKFQATCDTIDVSSGGALLRLPRELAAGTRLRLDILGSDRITEARVISSTPDGRKWKVRVQLLEQTGNFWGIKSPPRDWDPSTSPQPDEDDRRWVG